MQCALCDLQGIIVKDKILKKLDGILANPNILSIANTIWLYKQKIGIRPNEFYKANGVNCVADTVVFTRKGESLTRQESELENAIHERLWRDYEPL